MGKELISCKEIVRGERDGDKAVALLVLRKAGVKVQSKLLKEMRETEDEERLKAAYDVYCAYTAFIERDRRDKYGDAELYAHTFESRLNAFTKQKSCTVFVLDNAWIFQTGVNKFTYAKNKYNAAEADKLYKSVVAGVLDENLLLRVQKSMQDMQ